MASLWGSSIISALHQVIQFVAISSVFPIGRLYPDFSALVLKAFQSPTALCSPHVTPQLCFDSSSGLFAGLERSYWSSMGLLCGLGQNYSVFVSYGVKKCMIPKTNLCLPFLLTLISVMIGLETFSFLFKKKKKKVVPESQVWIVYSMREIPRVWWIFTRQTFNGREAFLWSVGWGVEEPGISESPTQPMHSV